MKTVLHDLGKEQNEKFLASADRVVCADGRYAPCQGCFKCWTKHPAACAENLYGSYSRAVKNILDRSIATSTPFSTYRGGQMHHTLRYGKRNCLRVIVYGSITDAEKNTWQLMTERNAMNMGFTAHSVTFCADAEEAGRKA